MCWLGLGSAFVVFAVIPSSMDRELPLPTAQRAGCSFLIVYYLRDTKQELRRPNVMVERSGYD
ncbi:hypothetical protein ACHAWX_006195 [Stephanocyclus meneghinianus]